jgi:anti-sigma regulatory factor (Ser/Thr protein kinase)
LLSAGAEPPEQTRVIAVPDVSHVGEARRAVASLSMQLGVDEHAAGRVAIVATELASNLAKHGGGGNLLVRAIDECTGIELLAVDHGPGIVDVDRAMRDGYSSGGTPGKGLGAVQRLSDVFDLYSAPGVGSVVLSRMAKLRGDRAPEPRLAEFGVVSVAAPGERVSGDAWLITPGENGPSVVVIDALGHGEVAHEASSLAVEIAKKHPGNSPTVLLDILHRGLRATRGAAVAVAEINPAARELRFAGVGNISCSIAAPGASRSFASLSGIVGHDVRRVQEFGAPYEAADMLIMFSDGIATRWRLDQYVGVRPRHPSLAAALVYRDYVRGRDDATILIARLPGDMVPA